MKIAILGSGSMGSAVASRLKRAGHDVVIGTRDARSGYTYEAAIQNAEIVFLTLPWPRSLEAVQNMPSFGNRVLVDVSNPETADGRGLSIGHTRSGAEEIAAAANDARVVKSLNHIYAEVLEQNVSFDGGVPSVFYCGDDAEAKRLVGQVIASCGFDAVDAGPLVNARYLEPLAMLTVQLVRVQNWGPTGIAFRMMRKTHL